MRSYTNIKNYNMRSAMRFAAVKYADRQRMLDVTFEDGDHFLIAVESLVASSDNGALADWSKIRIGETRDVIELPGKHAVIEIPWDRIRSIADPQFRTLLVDGAADRAHRLGKRIQAMRSQVGLSQAQLAAKAGVPPKTITNLEAGKIESATDLIEQVAVALGKRLRDFAEE